MNTLDVLQAVYVQYAESAKIWHDRCIFSYSFLVLQFWMTDMLWVFYMELCFWFASINIISRFNEYAKQKHWYFVSVPRVARHHKRIKKLLWNTGIPLPSAIEIFLLRLLFSLNFHFASIIFFLSPDIIYGKICKGVE